MKGCRAGEAQQKIGPAQLVNREPSDGSSESGEGQRAQSDGALREVEAGGLPGSGQLDDEGRWKYDDGEQERTQPAPAARLRWQLQLNDMQCQGWSARAA